jgi:flagellar biosynthesis/type III secretory pathway M-ring protein FliF/YscJ
MTTTQQSQICTPAKTKKQWNDLTPCQRSAVVAGAVVQVTLLAAAQIDLTRRPKEQIRGAKLLWRILVLVNFIGPIAYFAIGRKRSAATEPAEEPAGTEEPAEESAKAEESTEEESQPEAEGTDDPDQA